MNSATTAAFRANDVTIVGAKRDAITGFQRIVVQPVQTLTQFVNCLNKLIDLLIRQL